MVEGVEDAKDVVSWGRSSESSASLKLIQRFRSAKVENPRCSMILAGRLFDWEKLLVRETQNQSCHQRPLPRLAMFPPLQALDRP